jgi:hypothetical protein
MAAKIEEEGAKIFSGMLGELQNRARLSAKS